MIYVQMAACGLFNFLGSTTTSATAITTQRMFISRSLNKSPPVISQIIISFLGRKKGNEGGAAEQQQQQQKILQPLSAIVLLVHTNLCINIITKCF